jgi:bifunctional non-homologous end joining protein LigD
VRLFSRRGYDWTERYPLIREAMAALAQDAIMDGEAVVCNEAGVADFEVLQSREHDRRAFLYAFDLLELDGADLRPLPLEQRKDELRNLKRVPRAPCLGGGATAHKSPKAYPTVPCFAGLCVQS